MRLSGMLPRVCGSCGCGGGEFYRKKRASIGHGNTLTARTNTPAGSPEKKPTLPVASLLWLEMQQPLAGVSSPFFGSPIPR